MLEAKKINYIAIMHTLTSSGVRLNPSSLVLVLAMLDSGQGVVAKDKEEDCYGSKSLMMIITFASNRGKSTLRRWSYLNE